LNGRHPPGSVFAMDDYASSGNLANHTVRNLAGILEFRHLSDVSTVTGYILRYLPEWHGSAVTPFWVAVAS
jgi:hypothetical protein